MATVFIWNNHLLHLGHTWPGHASMSIDDQWPMRFLDADGSYVSWIPDHGQSHSGHDKGKNNVNIYADLTFETYAPDHVIRLNFRPEVVQELSQLWRTMRDKSRDEGGASYRFYRKNCSVMVSRILKASGRGGGFWNSNSPIMTPLIVKRLAMDMGGVKIEWTRFIDEIDQQIGFTSPETKRFLYNFKRREESRGSSNATARFTAAGGSAANDVAELRRIIRDEVDERDRLMEALGVPYAERRTR